MKEHKYSLLLYHLILESSTVSYILLFCVLYTYVNNYFSCLKHRDVSSSLNTVSIFVVVAKIVKFILAKLSIEICLFGRMMMLSMLKLLLIKHHFWLAVVSMKH